MKVYRDNEEENDPPKVYPFRGFKMVWVWVWV